jgi:hypothetical protein
MTGLIGWWPLHENSGKARDLSGNGNHGTLNGVTQGVEGRGGLTAYSFDGDDKLDAGSIPHLTKYTFSWWAKSRTPNDGNLHYHVDFRANNGAFGNGTGNGSLEWIHDNESETRFTVSAEIGALKWNHWCATWNGSKVILYKNGSQVDSTQVSSLKNWNFPNDTIGYYSPDNPRRFFNGTICDVRIYDRALSPQEIQTLYEWGNGDYTRRSLHDGSDLGAVSRWKFEKENMNRDNWGGNTLTDNTSAGSTSNAIDGTAKIFNGSSDHMSVANNSSFDVNAVTLSTWVNFDVVDDNYNGLVNSNVDNNGNSTYGLWRWRTGTSTDGIGFRINDDAGGSHKVSTGITPAPDVWYHYTGTFDGSLVRIYQNGRLVNETSANVTLASQTEDFWIGNTNGRSSKDALDGKIDDTRFYSRALSPSEVFQLYQWGTRGRDMRKLTVNARGDQ